MLTARIYEQNANWKQAINYYKLAQKVTQSIQDSAETANISLHLAEIFLIQNDLVNALQQVSFALKQYSLLNHQTGIALTYVKQAEIYRQKKQYKSGERLLLDKALPFFRSSGYQAGRIGCFDVLGKIYLNQKRYSEAKWFFIQANTQSRLLNDTEGTITSLINLVKVKVAIGDYKSAAKDLKEAQSLASKRNNLFLLANIKEASAILQKAPVKKPVSKAAPINPKEQKVSNRKI